MILKETLKKIVEEQKKDIESQEIGIIRDKKSEIPLNSSMTIIISGIRRCGKSTLLKQISKNYEQINYLNFEDPLLTSFENSDYETMKEVFEEINPKTKIYLFDEIQNIQGWERIARTLLDKKNTLFITGSNSSLLSKELGTKLTGRHLRYELFPFSYKEYLKFVKKKESPETLNQFIKDGGFPQYLKEKNDLLLKELLIDILTRDIIVRYKIKNVKAIRELLTYLITNTTTLQSYNNLKKIFEIKSVNTIKNYMQYLEDSYVIFSAPLFSYSLKKQIGNPRKIYGIDTGLIINNGVTFSENKGRLLENCIFLELKRRGKETYYHKDKSECDFVVKKGTQISEAIQVCYEINRENQDREIKGLMEVMKKYNQKTGIIITHNQEQKMSIEGKNIQIVPAWKWLINP